MISGLPPLLLTRGVCGLRLPERSGLWVEHFIFDGGELSEAALAPAAVVGVLDPGDDGQAEFRAGGPASAVQDVLSIIVSLIPRMSHEPGQGPGKLDCRLGKVLAKTGQVFSFVSRIPSIGSLSGYLRQAPRLARGSRRRTSVS